MGNLKGKIGSEDAVGRFFSGFSGNPRERELSNRQVCYIPLVWVDDEDNDDEDIEDGDNDDEDVDDEVLANEYVNCRLVLDYNEACTNEEDCQDWIVKIKVGNIFQIFSTPF